MSPILPRQFIPLLMFCPPAPPSLRSGQAIKGGKNMAKKLVPGGWRVEKVSSVQNQGAVSEITK
jgi:hypothetical protein